MKKVNEQTNDFLVFVINANLFTTFATLKKTDESFIYVFKTA
jgi:hypothetical protein